jgi:hypothetical protein
LLVDVDGPDLRLDIFRVVTSVEVADEQLRGREPASAHRARLIQRGAACHDVTQSGTKFFRSFGNVGERNEVAGLKFGWRLSRPTPDDGWGCRMSGQGLQKEGARVVVGSGEPRLVVNLRHIAR